MSESREQSASLNTAIEELWRGATGMSVPAQKSVRFNQFARGVRLLLNAAAVNALKRTEPERKPL